MMTACIMHTYIHARKCIRDRNMTGAYRFASHFYFVNAPQFRSKQKKYMLAPRIFEFIPVCHLISVSMNTCVFPTYLSYEYTTCRFLFWTSSLKSFNESLDLSHGSNSFYTWVLKWEAGKQWLYTANRCVCRFAFSFVCPITMQNVVHMCV